MGVFDDVAELTAAAMLTCRTCWWCPSSTSPTTAPACCRWCRLRARSCRSRSASSSCRCVPVVRRWCIRCVRVKRESEAFSCVFNAMCVLAGVSLVQRAAVSRASEPARHSPHPGRRTWRPALAADARRQQSVRRAGARVMGAPQLPAQHALADVMATRSVCMRKPSTHRAH